MTSASHAVSFKSASHPPVQVPRGKNLSLHLTASNSPVLFGCRTGICATCLSEVEGAIPPPDPDEAEVLEIFAPDNPRARLACQLKLTADIRLKWLGNGG